jgi:hypothetical protein
MEVLILKIVIDAFLAFSQVLILKDLARKSPLHHIVGAMPECYVDSPAK